MTFERLLRNKDIGKIEGGDMAFRKGGGVGCKRD